ncbi:unnamed protein product [Strongylus vulgaris]|uniref:Uncharacterized protein n=1 Tax=Strongylus vulgaris TaxID=40348 RepID=A0A3P7LLK6_STRVU|nr:unnamed protein product [Strongylus vulgaris]
MAYVCVHHYLPKDRQKKRKKLLRQTYEDPFSSKTLCMSSFRNEPIADLGWLLKKSESDVTKERKQVQSTLESKAPKKHEAGKKVLLICFSRSPMAYVCVHHYLPKDRQKKRKKLLRQTYEDPFSSKTLCMSSFRNEPIADLGWLLKKSESDVTKERKEVQSIHESKTPKKQTGKKVLLI